MKFLEHFLIKLDSWPWGAISRVLGLGIPPVFRALSAGRDGVGASLALFIGLLSRYAWSQRCCGALYHFPARRRELWRERHYIAKRHDSYQWQKLFWIGLGLLPYSVIGDGLRNGELVVTFICLSGGGVGLLFWRRVDATRSAT
jgi:hypothetical protein